MADALADSLAATDGSAEVAADGEVVVVPPAQAASTAPATANVKPRRVRVERVIGPPRCRVPAEPLRRAGRPAGTVEPVADAVWIASTVCLPGLQNRRGPRRSP